MRKVKFSVAETTTAETSAQLSERGVWWLTREHKFRSYHRDITVLGIPHTPEVLNFRQNDFEALFGRSSIVLTEYAPTIENYTAVAAISYLEEHGWKLSQERKDHIVGTFEFYTGVEQFARAYNKLLAVADPDSNSEIAESFTNLDRTATSVKGVMVVVGLAGIAFSLYYDSKKATQLREALPTRRKFLKTGLAAMAGLGTLSYAASSDSPELHPFVYDSVDYRSLIAAEGLDYIAKQLKEGQSAGAVYGMIHASQIAHYAKSPKLRNIGRKTYSPFENVAKPSLRVYMPRVNGWEKVKNQII